MENYDKYIVEFSGGKDSIACFLHLIDIGIPKEKIELWHHLVDGENSILFDWECTEDYCKKFAKTFDVPIYFSWKEGGFEREMNREFQRTAPIVFEDENHIQKKVGGERGSFTTRKKFPQVTADLKTRWCSPYLKIDVCTAAINNQDRFRGIRTLIITGERAQESDPNFLKKDPSELKGRGSYAVLEPDRADLREGKRYQRHVDHWRPIKMWPEEQVWGIIESYDIIPHPAYYLGWSRVSCKFCIFGGAKQFASAHHISPESGQKLIAYEKEFNYTMKRNMTLEELIQSGEIYEEIVMGPELVKVALNKEYVLPIKLPEGKKWKLPAGAFKKETCGAV